MIVCEKCSTENPGCMCGIHTFLYECAKIVVSDMYVCWHALFIIYDAKCVEVGSSYHLSLERILGVL